MVTEAASSMIVALQACSTAQRWGGSTRRCNTACQHHCSCTSPYLRLSSCTTWAKPAPCRVMRNFPACVRSITVDPERPALSSPPLKTTSQAGHSSCTRQSHTNQTDSFGVNTECIGHLTGHQHQCCCPMASGGCCLVQNAAGPHSRLCSTLPHLIRDSHLHHHHVFSTAPGTPQSALGSAHC